MQALHADPFTGENELAFADATASASFGGSASVAVAERRNPDDPATWGRVGRNEPCPCGSGKKYKHCHGQYA